jgi:glyoxylase-like metal-dependent hydrolase (beta-lactamase superfamily II)
MNLERSAAPGIHRVEDAYTNWYLVEGDDGALTIVDAGVRSSWHSLKEALGALGRQADDVTGLLLTHAHFDHIGFAERARSDFGIDVWVHRDDVPLTRHPLQYAHERSRLPYMLNPKSLPIFASLTRSGAFWPTPIAGVRWFTDDTAPEVAPAGMQLVSTPGHTMGHVAFHFPERDAVIAGDAIVNLDPYTGERGPRVVAGAATADFERAFDSLDALAATGASVVLTGHGEPWRDGAEAAVRHARDAGRS